MLISDTACREDRFLLWLVALSQLLLCLVTRVERRAAIFKNTYTHCLKNYHSISAIHKPFQLKPCSFVQRSIWTKMAKLYLEIATRCKTVAKSSVRTRVLFTSTLSKQVVGCSTNVITLYWVIISKPSLAILYQNWILYTSLSFNHQVFTDSKVTEIYFKESSQKVNPAQQHATN